MLEVYFYKFNGNIFWNIDDNGDMVNTIGMYVLLRRLTLPYKVKFSETCSESEIETILEILDDKNVKIEKGNRENTYVFATKKHEAVVYGISNMKQVYWRETYSNPYKVVETDTCKMLIEVTKDYAKKNDCKYYLLGEEMSEKDKDILKDEREVIECDYIYKMQDKDFNKKKLKRKVLANRRLV